MNQKELKELIEFLIEKDIAEFELERGDVKVKIKRAERSSRVARCRTPVISRASGAACQRQKLGGSLQPQPACGSRPAPAKRLLRKKDLHIVQSPIVGTFYESPSPGSPPFVKAGDTVEAGQVLASWKP